MCPLQLSSKGGLLCVHQISSSSIITNCDVLTFYFIITAKGSQHINRKTATNNYNNLFKHYFLLEKSLALVCVCVYSFYCIDQPVDQPQLSYMVNKVHKNCCWTSPCKQSSNSNSEHFKQLNIYVTQGIKTRHVFLAFLFRHILSNSIYRLQNSSYKIQISFF